MNWFFNNRSNYGGSNLTYNRPLQEQPYDNFLLNAYNQPNLVATRERRRFGEDVISSIGPAGFWGRGSGYPGSLYGNSSGWGNSSSSNSNESGNAGWGGYYGGSNLTYNRPLQEQPYDNFLLNAYNQPNLVATRERRRFGEDVISSIGPAGFWGRGSSYPGSLYGIG